MRESDVIEWLRDETASFLDASTLVSVPNPKGRVDEAQFHDGHVYPFVAVQQLGTASASAGIGNGELFVDDYTYSGGVLQSITYRRDVTLRVNLVPVTDDDPKLRDDLTTELADHYSLLTRKGGLPADVGDVSVGEATPQDRPDDRVAADGVPLTVDYSRYLVDDDPAVAESVTVDVDVSDDIPDYNGTLAVSDTFSVDDTTTVDDLTDAHDATV